MTHNFNPLCFFAIAFTLMPVGCIAYMKHIQLPACDPVLEVRNQEGVCQSRAQVRGPAPAFPE